MPPGTSVPPGLPGPPARYPTKRGRNAGPLGNGPLGCGLAIALFLIVAAALVWVVVNRQ